MKYIDKFLKYLKTDRNTFLTYFLTLVSIYILVDRVVELLFMMFTGISVSYWGPLAYSIAIIFPVFAFFLSGASSFAKSDKAKFSFVYTYIVTLYVIGISMLVQWLNEFMWLFFISVPNYISIITTSPELVKPAFTAIAIYIPLTTFYGVFRFIYTKVHDNKDMKDSILDYGGIDLSAPPAGIGAYSCEIEVCRDAKSGSAAMLAETRRFEGMFVAGISGSGKTTMVIEPMIARDLKKKYFFREMAKEMGYTALRTGIAILTKPYSNEYLNKHFSLSMIQPVETKKKLYHAYMKKLIVDDSTENILYKDLGITAISPDYESTSHILDVAKNFDIPVNIIDPTNPDSLGLNPFSFEDTSQTATAISSVLKGMYNTSHTDVELAFRENVAAQAIESLSILLKEMYPRLNDGDLPTLEDMLDMLNNFDLVEDMCKKLEYDEALAKKYRLQIGYFKKNFYRSGSGREDTEKFVYVAMTQLDNLLRIDGVRSILCNRNNNLDFDKALSEGQVTLVCTRKGDIGITEHQAFGLFFLLLMQHSVLKRPGNEKTRLPNFLYIDEFPDFICSSTESIFTLYRKYRVAPVITAQNLDQLGLSGQSKYRQTILSNSHTKVLFGSSTKEDSEWWAEELGNHREWRYTSSYNTDKGSYDPKLASVAWAWKINFEPDKLRALSFKAVAFRMPDAKGKRYVSVGKVDFLASEYKEKHKSKFYDFSKFTGGISEEDPDSLRRKKKFDYKNVDFTDVDRSDEVDPVKTDTSDSSYLFDNENAVIVNLKRRKNTNG